MEPPITDPPRSGHPRYMYSGHLRRYVRAQRHVYRAKPHTRYKEVVLALENVATCTSFLHSKDMEKVCIGQTIDRIANITHQ